mmetsp:Transcript_22912/g.48755  ORF Transcript_22912/g.48755 Transcript_22912/m.48755 type:complete len:201 (-) Transcript_22912:519-1121(-)|eukprot:CAMPEP_0201124230 /NCGR_PEP_ID=MMETSP0850-20130426/10630_1 /ASSEMBLY_ACC=CAM_ASM_000622 /TAXON_ID=183588 /ORGANISM="Pseudo-nitzschia fraudulenta, Strain WWA7" /LENGTH=200 /DNA_ID=CAMNT_0047391433 /DNA_START=268 /DNA_END=870 /DNA_ORIENTATION=+
MNRTPSLLVAIVVFALLGALSEAAPDANETAVDANSTAAPTEEEFFRCFGICKEDEGVLVDSSKVVDYQWNLRVPVCSGASCQTGTCRALEESLPNWNLTSYDCERHRYKLRTVAGCSCTEEKNRGFSSTGVYPPQTFVRSPDDPEQWWIMIVCVSLLVVLWVVGFFFERRKQNEVEYYDEEEEGEDEEDQFEEEKQEED